MPPHPPRMVALLAMFALAFSRPTFAWALVLLCGTLLASERLTIGAALVRWDWPRTRASWPPTGC